MDLTNDIFARLTDFCVIILLYKLSFRISFNLLCFFLLITVINAHTSLYYNSYFSVRICEILKNFNFEKFKFKYRENII